jgi:hypothetical protein
LKQEIGNLVDLLVQVLILALPQGFLSPVFSKALQPTNHRPVVVALALFQSQDLFQFIVSGGH